MLSSNVSENDVRLSNTIIDTLYMFDEDGARSIGGCPIASLQAMYDRVFSPERIETSVNALVKKGYLAKSGASVSFPKRAILDSEAAVIKAIGTYCEGIGKCYTEGPTRNWLEFQLIPTGYSRRDIELGIKLGIADKKIEELAKTEETTKQTRIEYVFVPPR